MNPLIQLKKAAPVFLVAVVCFGFLPKMQAVIPAPDGGYPNANTAEGKDALLNLTSGIGNTALGQKALVANTTGSRNVGTGTWGALQQHHGQQQHGQWFSGAPFQHRRRQYGGWRNGAL